jgi:hypothetical protein
MSVVEFRLGDPPDHPLPILFPISDSGHPHAAILNEDSDIISTSSISSVARTSASMQRDGSGRAVHHPQRFLTHSAQRFQQQSFFREQVELREDLSS